MREVPGGVAAPCGFEASGVRCGIKSRGLDLALIYSVAPAAAAGVFTTNRFQAAPVLVTKDRIGREPIHGVVINSGNANACTGGKGYRDAVHMANLTADALAVPKRSVLVCSTGVIGRPLPMSKLSSGIKQAAAALDPEGGSAAAQAIMTTDTRPKSVAVEFELDGRPVRVGGMAKGAGMIAPNMATLLAFITTDASLSPGLLQSRLGAAVKRSFHRITVDGDTSTNDTVLLLANRQAEAARITPQHGLSRFREALDYVADHLARELVRDGEGASRMIEVRVRGAASESDARRIARTIAESPLVKTAIAGGDPNWGRVLAAAGRAGVSFVPGLVDLSLGTVQVVRGGAVARHRASAARSAVRTSEVRITLDLNAGDREAVMWTCDLTRDYVRINAEYHT
ncbi:MAG: bifunctional glutamate N-acetyltransferase/amino-acid acetyltransferase ArgJ [Armatimonadota bacterium]|nr:MAG: bifunctional glutamate N-acetyltransferase/amino-acid acetyltransferase ArgJ [Armatimonadota bacterium]